MIHIIIGTKAQLIKMAPVMRRLSDRKIPYNYISTGQHRSTMSDIHQNFGIRGPDIRLYSGPDITSITKMFVFGVRILWRTIRQRRIVFKDDRQGIVLVHGDTFSTLLGALMGRLCGIKIGHVESGLRSFNIFSPFPEEITRILVFHLSHYHFCPGEWAIRNLDKFRGIKINTRANTLLDSLQYALRNDADPLPEFIPEFPYGVVTLHRFENIRNEQSIRKLVDSVLFIATKHRLIFVLHPPTEIRLRKFGYFDTLAENPNIELRPRYNYFDFMKLIQHAEIVVSDGGSNQEECFYLGKPLLLLRNETERLEGIGENAILSKFDQNTISDFLDNYKNMKKNKIEYQTSPTDIIIEACSPFFAKQQ